MTDKEIRITRVLDAPRDAVWKAWTEPWRLDRWHGPKDITSHDNTIDLRVGGKYLSAMRLPDGKDVWSTGIIKEIDAPARLVMTDSFADEKGNVVPATHYGFEKEFPLELLVTLTFDDLGDKTGLYLIHSGVESLDQKVLADMEQGWNEMIDKLNAFLRSAARTKIVAEPGSMEMVSTRIFDGPREAVFQVMTDPILIPEWWGPRRLTTRIDTMDLRPGGNWRFVQHDVDGKEYAFHGEYKEIVPSARIVQTFEYEGMPGHVLVDTTEFDDIGGGKTRVTTTSTFETVDDRDGMLATGAEEGTIESNDRIDGLLADLITGAIICTKVGCTESL